MAAQPVRLDLSEVPNCFEELEDYWSGPGWEAEEAGF